MLRIKIRQANFSEHKNIVAVSKQSKYTRDYTNRIFSGEPMYKKGWIRVAEDIKTGRIVGFTCVRHKVREPETVIYFIGVDSELRSGGVGGALLHDVMKQSPHRRIALNVMNENEGAIRFYLNNGFGKAGYALKGKGVHLVRVF